jgi:hypothetical protein
MKKIARVVFCSQFFAKKEVKAVRHRILEEVSNILVTPRLLKTGLNYSIFIG